MGENKCTDCEKTLDSKDETFTRMMGFVSPYCINCGNSRHAFDCLIRLEYDNVDSYSGSI